ncbi:hypothetical protein Athai_66420 [Actinocatenispora thailandica]|uniref:Mycothiol-dependent maleylpyruvate isomerase metal-binding domain-containing protein n=1 Tax=Actinocatenispora thailandica TaxID=227318 RepID=A0A7R7I124_9ACTN|nr:maleylpyruvate isomerase family mycothiol-dependent enzyme [Actinocatenispora thailandica]BCJ39139.1 hypothetical protein Athai_66420 [Actinocatenispora thailandica]
MPMPVADHLATLRAEGELLAAAADGADLAAPVPTCPGWTLRDLLRHIGGIHRWAGHFVTTGRAEASTDELDRELMETWGADADLVDWFRAGHAALVTALAEAPDSLSCWTFLPAPSPRAFWARRQAHETSIHRVDAQSAVGPVTGVAPEFGADGLDELLLRFLTRRRHRSDWGAPSRLSLTATDVDRRWLVEISTAGVRTDADPTAADCAAADCAITASASDLYHLMWNRREHTGLVLAGDPEVLDRWRTAMTVRWS